MAIARRQGDFKSSGTGPGDIPAAPSPHAAPEGGGHGLKDGDKVSIGGTEHAIVAAGPARVILTDALRFKTDVSAETAAKYMKSDIDGYRLTTPCIGSLPRAFPPDHLAQLQGLDGQLVRLLGRRSLVLQLLDVRRV